MTKKDKKEQLRRWFTILKFALLILIVVGLPLYILVYHWEWISTLRDLDQVRELIAGYKKEGALIYVLAQVLQIIVCILPGQPLQIAIGFMFGFFIAYALSLLGAGVGTVITYYLGKLLGRDAVHMLFGEKRIGKYIDRMNSKRAVTIVFLIYLIPGLPKDIVSYAAGISDMKLKPFLLISLVGRSPGMIASLLIGKQIYAGSYTSAIVIAAVALVACIIAIFYRQRLIAWFDRAYDRIYETESAPERPENGREGENE